MKKILKKILSPLYKFLSNDKERELYKLFIFWGGTPRNYEKNIVVSAGKFHVSDVLSFLHQFKEIIVEEIYKFTSTKKNPVIYDCGANVGLSCAYFKSLYPNAIIKAFEADNNICNLLKENILLNKIEGIVVYNQAVWINGDGIQFSSDGADGGSIFGPDNITTIPSLRLRDLIVKEESIDMLKIDIEGAEVEVIKDCADLLERVENIFIEYHSWKHRPQQLGELLQVLSKAGFRYYIKTLGDRSEPLINTGRDLSMDLQLNIFAYRT